MQCAGALPAFIILLVKDNRFREIRTERHPDGGNVPVFGFPVFLAGVHTPSPHAPKLIKVYKKPLLSCHDLGIRTQLPPWIAELPPITLLYIKALRVFTR